MGVHTKAIDYPLWFLSLYDAAGKPARVLEQTIIDFVNNTDIKRQQMSPMNYLVDLVFTYLCGFYKVDITTITVKKQNRLCMSKATLKPVICSPPAYEAVTKKYKVLHPSVPYDFIINVIVYDNENFDKTTIIHLTQIKDVIYNTIEKFLGKIKFNCRQEIVNKQNIILFFKDEETLNHAITNFEKMNGFVIRDDLLIPERRPLIKLKNADGTFTDVALKIICGMLNDRFRNKQIVQKIMMEMPAYMTQVLSNYKTNWNRLFQSDEPTLNLELNVPEGFMLKEMYVEFMVTKTIINKVVGYHENLRTFDLDLYIGASPEKRLKVEWIKTFKEENKSFNFWRTITKESDLVILRRKKLFVWMVYHNKEVIGNHADVSFYFEAHILPTVQMKKKK